MSIRTRLTLWYTGLLAVFLLIFNILVYAALQGVLIREVENRLVAVLDQVTERIQTENDPLAVVISGQLACHQLMPFPLSTQSKSHN